MGVQKPLMIVQKPAIIKGFCTPIYGTQYAFLLQTFCNSHSQFYRYCIETDAESALNCDDFLTLYREVRAAT